MSKKKRLLLNSAAIMALGWGSAYLSGSASAAIAYDANSGAGNAGGVFAGDSHYGQDITLTGTGLESLNSFTVFGIRWNQSSTTSQGFFLDFYTGANESSSAINALAGATHLGGAGFSLPYPGTVGSYNYTVPLSSSNIQLPGGTPIFVEATFTDSTFSNYSTILYARFSPGVPVVGSNPGFVWVDSNLDNVFSGAEESSTLSGGATTNIRMAIDTTVPEPASLGLLVGGLALASRRPKRR